MKTHLRQSKNNMNPACTPSGTERNTVSASPADFYKSSDKCKKCDVIFENRRANAAQ